MCVYVCVRVRVYVCVRACVRAYIYFICKVCVCIGCPVSFGQALFCVDRMD